MAGGGIYLENPLRYRVFKEILHEIFFNEGNKIKFLRRGPTRGNNLLQDVTYSLIDLNFFIK